MWCETASIQVVWAMIAKKFASLVLLSLLIGSSYGASLVVQAQSGQAHPILIKAKGYKAAPPSSTTEAGKRIYGDAHCSSCHSINDMGGHIGPPLDGIGVLRESEFLFARLANTPESEASYAKLTGQNVTELTPHVRLSPESTRALVAYLLSLPEPRGGFAIFSHPHPPSAPAKSAAGTPAVPNSANIEEGKKLYDRFGCAQCHQIRNAGGSFGPALDGIGVNRSADFVAAHISNAQLQAVKEDKFFELVPTTMPKFTASKEQIQQLTDYLMSLPVR
jgi:mono/diheme cytochrome c family protein